jgi:hypothetical protein
MKGALSRARAWYERNTFASADFGASHGASVSVCLPARNEAATIAPILSALMPLLRSGVLAQLVVVDDSCDGTAQIARRDAFAAVGLEGIAQVDLGVRDNGHQPLLQLGPMAHSVLLAIASRLRDEGRLSGPVPTEFLPRGAVDALDGKLVVRPPRTEDQARACAPNIPANRSTIMSRPLISATFAAGTRPGPIWPEPPSGPIGTKIAGGSGA